MKNKCIMALAGAIILTVLGLVATIKTYGSVSDAMAVINGTSEMTDDEEGFDVPDEAGSLDMSEEDWGEDWADDELLTDDMAEPELNDTLINIGLVLAVLAVATLAIEPLLLAVVFAFGIKRRPQFGLGRAAGLAALARPLLLAVAGALLYFGFSSMLGGSVDEEEAEGLPFDAVLAIIAFALSLVITFVYGIKYAKFFGVLRQGKGAPRSNPAKLATIVWLLWTAVVLVVTHLTETSAALALVPIAGVVSCALMIPCLTRLKQVKALS